MSSRRTDHGPVEAWSILIACTLAILWYAIPQLPYTLIFFYQLARAVFPHLVPQIGPL